MKLMQQQQSSLLVPSKLGSTRDETHMSQKIGTKQERQRRKGDKKPKQIRGKVKKYKQKSKNGRIKN
jgi:hypothetical protein